MTDTPETTPCRVCGEPLPPRARRRGRPPVTHPECRRAARTSYERTRRRERREGWTLALVKACEAAEAACDAAEGASNLDAWTVSRGDAEAASGAPLAASFVPDRYVTVARSDPGMTGNGDPHEDDRGPEVGRTSCSVGPTLGAWDRVVCRVLSASGRERLVLSAPLSAPGVRDAVEVLAARIGGSPPQRP